MESVLSHLREQVRPFVVREIVDAALAFGSEENHANNLGHLCIPREVFSVIDHLGSLITSEGSTRRSVKFIHEYFPEHYGDNAQLLHAMWRHGLVHAWQPYSYTALVDEHPVTVRWLSSNHARAVERGNHLLTFRHASEPETIILVVNTCELAEDLLLAVDRFIRALEDKADFDAKCAERLEQALQVRDVGTIQGAHIRDTVQAQIAASWESAGGVIEDGHVVELHPGRRGIDDA